MPIPEDPLSVLRETFGATEELLDRARDDAFEEAGRRMYVDTDFVLALTTSKVTSNRWSLRRRTSGITGSRRSMCSIWSHPTV